MKTDSEGETYCECKGFFVGKYLIQPIEWPSFNTADVAIYDTTKGKKEGLIYQSNIDLNTLEAYEHGIKVALLLSIAPHPLVDQLNLSSL